LSNYRLIK